MVSLNTLNENILYQELIGKKVRDIKECPVLSKKDYDKAINNLYTRYSMSDPFWHGVYWSPTGGSTSAQSKSMYFPWDNIECQHQRFLMGKCLAEENTGIFKKYNVVANLFAGTSMYRSMELFSQLAVNAGITNLPIGLFCSNEQIHEFVEHFKPDIIAGSPVKIADYASYCIRNDYKTNISGVLYATNPLFSAQEKLIKTAFANPDIFSVYGSAETGPWAFYNDKVLEKNQFIVVSEIASVEVLNKDAEGFGDVVVTIKVRERFPVVRYALGDIGRIKKMLFADKEHQVLELKGRSARWLSFADSNVELERIESELEECLDWQIVQCFEENNSVEVVDVRVLATGDLDLPRLKATLEKLFYVEDYSGALRVNVEKVSFDDLIKSKLSQKVIKVVDRRA